MNAKTGLVTGFSREKNQDGKTEVLTLQLVVSELTDVRKVQHDTLAGVDSNPPPLSRATIIDLGGYYLVVAVDDNVPKESLPGENEIYSSAAGVKLARIKAGIDGLAKIQNDFMSLKKALKTFVDATKDIVTTGSPASHTVSAASKADLIFAQLDLDLILGEE